MVTVAESPGLSVPWSGENVAFAGVEVDHAADPFEASVSESVIEQVQARCKLENGQVAVGVETSPGAPTAEGETASVAGFPAT